MRRFDLVVWLLAAIACAEGSADARPGPDGSGRPTGLAAGTELIPAEWTVAEDTASDGEIVTTSLQLPSARDIAGLLRDESPRLILRCMDGRVAAYIETDPVVEPDSTGAGQVRVELDSAPSCE